MHQANATSRTLPLSSPAPSVTARQREIFQSAAGRILPSDDGPGACQANVIGYFDWLTRQRFANHFLGRLMSGLDILDEFAISRWGHGFVECSAVQQDSVLCEIQAIPHVCTKKFFGTLINVTIAGFLCDPKYDGNRNLVGWQSIHFNPIPGE